MTLPYIHEYTDCRGKVRRYVRKGKKIPLKLDPEHPGFLAEYQAALARLAPATAEPVKGTWDALITGYLKSAKFKKLRDSTKGENRREAENIRRKWGKFPVDRLEPRHILEWQDELCDTPGKANNMLACVKLLLRWGKPRGFKHQDPAAGIEELKIGELRSWTDGELAKFEATWPVGSRERLIYALALYTGQRKSDLLAMTRAHIDGGWMGVAQQKTGVRLAIPVHVELAAALAATPSSGLALIQRLDGKSLKSRELHDVFAAATAKAELTGCTLHGLRKAAARKLAEAGATPHEIMAITGHQTLGMVQHYTRGANQKKLAIEAIRLWENRNKT